MVFGRSGQRARGLVIFVTRDGWPGFQPPGDKFEPTDKESRIAFFASTTDMQDSQVRYLQSPDTSVT